MASTPKYQHTWYVYRLQTSSKDYGPLAVQVCFAWRAQTFLKVYNSQDQLIFEKLTFVNWGQLHARVRTFAQDFIF